MRRGCPDVALCDGGQALEFAVAIGGTADAEGRAAMGAPDAIDPLRTLTVLAASRWVVKWRATR